MPSLDLDRSPHAAHPDPCEVRRTTKAMASVITALVPRPVAGDGVDARIDTAIERGFEEFRALERDCSRFDQNSALMRANRHPGRWHRVPEPLYALFVEAVAEHRRTGGLFDPRVHDRLVQLGYDRSFHLMLARQGDAGAHSPSPHMVAADPGAGWRPRAIPVLRFINFGGARIDLGGIGKGLAIRRAAARIRPVTGDFLLDAGGDLYAAGAPPDVEGWRINIESPSGSERPVAVLEVSDKAVATSSIRVRNWKRGDRQVHHLIDPRTGEPGGDGLAAVTVVGDDPVGAEIAAKTLFLSGRDAIDARAAALGVAAFWAGADGTTGASPAIEPFVIWTDA